MLRTAEKRQKRPTTRRADKPENGPVPKIVFDPLKIVRLGLFLPFFSFLGGPGRPREAQGGPGRNREVSPSWSGGPGKGVTISQPNGRVRCQVASRRGERESLTSPSRRPSLAQDCASRPSRTRLTFIVSGACSSLGFKG